MGITVHLAVATDRVSDTVWREIYEQARLVAKRWTPRPLAVAWRQIGAVKVVQYTPDIETAEGLHLVGDAESLTTGDSFVFPARLDRAASGRDRTGRRLATAEDDVLVDVARWLGSGDIRRVSWRDLLGAKTQGLPYHVLMIALGLVVEHALPRAAVVYGEISARDGEQARCGASSILGEELALPVVVDARRLRRRLGAALGGAELEEAIGRLAPVDPYLEARTGDLLGLLRRSPRTRIRHELEHVVLSCRDPDRLARGTRQVLRKLVEAIRSNVSRWEVRARIEHWGAARTREEIAHRTRTNGLRLTSTAWDAVEVAELDELAFLLVAACMDATTMEVHQAVRAVLENRALRRV